MSTPIHLAQKMGKELGRSEILQRKMQTKQRHQK